MENIIKQAFAFAKEKHERQTKPGGRSLIKHLTVVANTLEQQHVDEEIVAAALLHDTVEDTETSLDEIKHQFGERVAFMVDGLTSKSVNWRDHLDKIKEYAKKERGILLIKIADLQDNLKNIQFFKEEKRKKVKLWFLAHMGMLFTQVETEQEKKMLETLVTEFNKGFP